MKTRITLWVGVACLACLPGGVVVRAGQGVPDAVATALKSADEGARLRAIDQLGSCGPQAVALLTSTLQDPSAAVRAHAAAALGAVGAPAKSAAAPLAELVKDKDETVRRQAIKALQSIRPGPKIMVPLCVQLMEDPDPGVRVRVLKAITEAGPTAVPALIEALGNEKAAYWACLVLHEIGPAGKAAIPALVEKLKDPRPQIRREAVLALGAMGEAAASALPQVTALLNDPHAQTAATFVFGQVGQIPADAETIIRANVQSNDKLLGTTSLWALARVHPEDKDLRRQATEQLIARLKDQDPFVRTAAARALAALPPAPEITAPIWEKTLQDADATTMHHALDALAALGPAAVPRLTDALKFEKLRGPVAAVLGRIGPAAAPATASLAALIDDKNDEVAREAILALANIGPGAKEAVPVLVKALQQAGAENSNLPAIAYALGKIGPDAAAAEAALSARLNDPDRYLALVSAWALLQIQPASAELAAKTVPILIKGLAQPIPQCRQSAAEALGRLGPLAKDAVAALQKVAAAEHENAAVRDAAKKALAAIQ